jgi:3-oxoacyl-[acyl-carrier protein] reductase
MRLDGLNALVTGAAHGIGEAIARAFHAEGAAVVLGDVELAPAAAIAGELGERARAVELDVRDPDSVRAGVELCGRLDILVNNAARILPGSVWDISVEDWDDVLAVNLRGPLLTTQAAAPQMRANGFGRIVNVASIAGQSGGLVGGAHYSASKGGLIVLTKVFARELAGDGVTVNAIAPAAIEGRVMESISDERRRELAASIPVGRFGTAEEVAALTVFLASRDAGFITGATFDQNGGLLMR